MMDLVVVDDNAVFLFSPGIAGDGRLQHIMPPETKKDRIYTILRSPIPHFIPFLHSRVVQCKARK